MRGLAVSLLALAAAVAATAAAAGVRSEAPRGLRFATLVRESHPDRSTDPSSSASAIVLDRKLGVGPGGVDPPAQAKIDAVDYRQSFVLVAMLVRPTSGWAIDIRRISAQGRGERRQLCVVAAVTPPKAGTAVAQVKTISLQVVKLARRPFGVDVPQAIVLRQTTGKLLFATTAFTRRGLCRV